jgi:hypothetical protein
MADLPSERDSHRPADESPGPGVPTGAPRWVKVFVIIAVVVAALIVIMLLTGHGPGRHMR